MRKDQYENITQWQNDVFTSATPLSCANHLEEEVGELKKSIESGNLDKSEIADCFLLLIGVCNKAALSYEEICSLIDQKMAVNHARKWGAVNEKGYVKHVE